LKGFEWKYFLLALLYSSQITTILI
jgi:hypothetical protein